MNKKENLLKRLDEIGESLKISGNGLGLLGLGSVGNELQRLDEYSDLDFFAIVKNGYKRHYIQNLDWLSSIKPIVYCFRNTADGFKLLFEDGIFCEMAVFEPHELSGIPFSEGRWVWKSDELDGGLNTPKIPYPKQDQKSVEWMVGEAITCLYVGLGRFHRGEKLSAFRFIQNYAVDRILELTPLIEPELQHFKDVFSGDRRFEKRFSSTAELFSDFIQGYDRSPESAKAILEFLNNHFEVNEEMKKQILEMC